MRKITAFIVLLIATIFLLSVSSTAIDNANGFKAFAAQATGESESNNGSNDGSQENEDETETGRLDYIQPISIFGDYGMFVMIGGIVIIFYFFMIRPEGKRKKKAAAMRSSLGVGDEITSIEGIVGTIVAISSEDVVIETSEEKARIKMARWAISTSSSVPPDPPRNKKKIIIIAGSAAVAVTIIIALLFVFVIPPMNHYNQAAYHFNEGEFKEALTALDELPDDYRDVSILRQYIGAFIMFEMGEFKLAAGQFEDLSGFRRSSILKNESQYQLAIKLMEDGKTNEAILLLELLGEYRDSAELLETLSELGELVE